MSTEKYYRSQYYVQGSTVRKHQMTDSRLTQSSHAYAQLNTASKTAGQRRLKAVPDRKKKYERGRREETVIKTMPAQAWDLKSLMFIIAAVVVTFGMCISYLQAQESITAMSKKAASLESEIMILKNQNDAEYNRVDSSVDLSYVYEVAVNELGMVHAKDNQVIPYNSRKSNSVRQYGEIPQETERFSRLFGGK